MSGGGDIIKVWDVSTGAEVMTLHGRAVWSVVFSPDGKRIVAGCGNIKVWDAETGAEVMTLQVDDSSVWPVSFSPDGRLIVSGCEDGTIKLWESASPEEVEAKEKGRMNKN